MDVDNPSPTPPSDDPANDGAEHDGFGPPAEPCLCYCLHCHREFMSDGMWFQEHTRNGKPDDGFWMCPTPNCGGAGFTFDIFPVDPDHPANAGWTYSNDEEGDYEQGWDADDEDSVEPAVSTDGGETYDPFEPAYAEEDLEGEEWKHGLQPGESLPEPPQMAEARRQQEEEEKKYDMPDERPRRIDFVGEPDPPKPWNDEDPPF